VSLRALIALAPLAALVLAACGAYQPPAGEASSLAARQTAVALQGRPTLPPVQGAQLPTVPPRPTPDLAQLFELSADDPRAIGDPAAPVTIVELTDFE
jgi:protein-disulfide isomerase